MNNPPSVPLTSGVVNAPGGHGVKDTGVAISQTAVCIEDAQLSI